MPIVWDFAEDQKSRNRTMHPSGTVVGCLVAAALVGLIFLAAVIIAAGISVRPVWESMK